MDLKVRCDTKKRDIDVPSEGLSLMVRHAHKDKNFYGSCEDTKGLRENSVLFLPIRGISWADWMRCFVRSWASKIKVRQMIVT